MTIETNGKSNCRSGPVGLAAAGLILGLLAGCSGYQGLPQDTLDGDYTVRGIRWTSGGTTLVFMKAFDHEGKLAICGAYTNTGHADLSGEAVRQYVGTANMYIGDERIGPLSFSNSVRQQQVRWAVLGGNVVVTESNEPANCVDTGKSWRDSYGTGQIHFKGPSRIVVPM